MPDNSQEKEENNLNCAAAASSLKIKSNSIRSDKILHPAMRIPNGKSFNTENINRMKSRNEHENKLDNVQ